MSDAPFEAAVMLSMKPVPLVGLALIVGAASCSDAVGPSHPTTLQAAHQLWRAQGLHTYAFTVQRSCFCGNVHPLYVLVLSDTVAGVLDLETAAPVDRQLGETVEDLFTFIQNAIDQRAQRIDANYDAAKGFPTEIDFDGSATIADDEISYRVSDVHPVAPPAGDQRLDRNDQPERPVVLGERPHGSVAGIPSAAVEIPTQMLDRRAADIRLDEAPGGA